MSQNPVQHYQLHHRPAQHQTHVALLISWTHTRTQVLTLLLKQYLTHFCRQSTKQVKHRLSLVLTLAHRLQCWSREHYHHRHHSCLLSLDVTMLSTLVNMRKRRRGGSCACQSYCRQSAWSLVLRHLTHRLWTSLVLTLVCRRCWLQSQKTKVHKHFYKVLI